MYGFLASEVFSSNCLSASWIATWLTTRLRSEGSVATVYMSRKEEQSFLRYCAAGCALSYLHGNVNVPLERDRAGSSHELHNHTFPSCCRACLPCSGLRSPPGRAAAWTRSLGSRQTGRRVGGRRISSSSEIFSGSSHQTVATRRRMRIQMR